MEQVVKHDTRVASSARDLGDFEHILFTSQIGIVIAPAWMQDEK